MLRTFFDQSTHSTKKSVFFASSFPPPSRSQLSLLDDKLFDVSGSTGKGVIGVELHSQLKDRGEPARPPALNVDVKHHNLVPSIPACSSSLPHPVCCYETSVGGSWHCETRRVLSSPFNFLNLTQMIPSANSCSISSLEISFTSPSLVKTIV